jgi:predicted nucleic acid-binding Zn ribbon protein
VYYYVYREAHRFGALFDCRVTENSGETMPIYVYKNLKTGETFEVEQRITEGALSSHPETGDPVKRLIQPVGIAFKGSGFYVNDSKNSSKSSKPKTDAPADTAKSESTSSDAAKTDTNKTDTAKSETKAETKSEAKPEAKPKTENKPAAKSAN